MTQWVRKRASHESMGSATLLTLCKVETGIIEPCSRFNERLFQSVKERVVGQAQCGLYEGTGADKIP